MERDIRLTATETNGKTITYNMVDIDLEEARNMYDQIHEFIDAGGSVEAISFTVMDKNHEVKTIHAQDVFVDARDFSKVAHSHMV